MLVKKTNSYVYHFRYYSLFRFCNMKDNQTFLSFDDFLCTLDAVSRFLQFSPACSHASRIRSHSSKCTLLLDLFILASACLIRSKCDCKLGCMSWFSKDEGRSFPGCERFALAKKLLQCCSYFFTVTCLLHNRFSFKFPILFSVTYFLFSFYRSLPKPEEKINMFNEQLFKIWSNWGANIFLSLTIDCSCLYSSSMY